MLEETGQVKPCIVLSVASSVSLSGPIPCCLGGGRVNTTLPAHILLKTRDYTLVLPLLFHSLIVINVYLISEKQHGDGCSLQPLQAVKKTDEEGEKKAQRKGDILLVKGLKA